MIIINVLRERKEKTEEVTVAGATGYLGRFVVQDFKRRENQSKEGD